MTTLLLLELPVASINRISCSMSSENRIVTYARPGL